MIEPHPLPLSSAPRCAQPLPAEHPPYPPQNTPERGSTLDEIEREMSGNELIITNGKKPIAVAGVMGGLNSAVTKDTTAVVIESAYFDPPTIRIGAKALNMSTDASKRFERGPS